MAAALALQRHAPSRARLSAAPEPVHVGVIGGGTAGHLTALAIQRCVPGARVTLVESSTIPVIGVGEASTPDLVSLLLDVIGVDEIELHREVAPTLKLGIRFVWGDPEHPDFLHPFSGQHLLEAHVHAGNPDLQSLGAMMMRAGVAPILRQDDGTITPLLSSIPYALHLDNARFVAFLRSLATARGIAHIDAVVDDVAVASAGTGVTRLHTSDGRSLRFDLYVDATGFRSRLLGEALGVPFVPYDTTLFTDAAWTTETHRPQEPALYTEARSMDAGWRWTIPMRDQDHHGYVFSTRFATPESALDELMRSLPSPALGPPRLIRFRSGRREGWWVGNVAAIGNAYAFVEPLESTALHMVVHQIEELVRALSAPGDHDAARARANTSLNRHWDVLRGFLALHYRFARRGDTPFWRACRDEVDLGLGAAMADAFREGAPLSARPDLDRLRELVVGTPYFGFLGVDNVLFGQGLRPPMLEAASELGTFDRWARVGAPALLARALPHREALDAYVRWLDERRTGGRAVG